MPGIGPALVAMLLMLMATILALLADTPDHAGEWSDEHPTNTPEPTQPAETDPAVLTGQLTIPEKSLP